MASRSSGQQTARTKRQELGDRSRGEILDAALRAMAVYGYEGTSIARIAAESGLPSSSIYWHFSSKAGVLAAVMERGSERFFADSSADLRASDSPTTGPGLLRAALRHSARTADAHPEFLRLLLLLTVSDQHDERILGIVQSVTERGMNALHSLLRETFAASGAEPARLVADRLVVFAQGAFDGAFLASQTHVQVSHESLVDTLADALLALGEGMLAATDD